MSSLQRSIVSNVDVPGELPPLGHVLNAHDFELAARAVMPSLAWNYYSSGADDEITMRANRAAFNQILLRPRVLVDGAAVDTATSILGSHSSFPVSNSLLLKIELVQSLSLAQSRTGLLEFSDNLIVNICCWSLMFASHQLYISASARVGLAHSDGETALTNAAHTTGIIQMVGIEYKHDLHVYWVFVSTYI